MLSAHIVLKFESNELARTALDAITPDNEPLPEGLQIECSVDKREMRISVISNRTIDGLRATIEDIMSAVDLAVRAVECAEL
ncbi:hypothetical protein EU546_01115 [Candidatus Thorarchaeota archaeon]|nr:MAG: hypothetical protein EU546_01115 [Candidatus Thorarchaeota archaeon]